MLRSEQLKNDPRVLQAKKLLQDALKDHKSSITSISPPLADKKLSYKELLNEFNKLRGNNLWYPYLGSGIGNSSYVELLDGSVKLDFINGIGVYYTGHSDSHMLNASIESALNDTIMEGNLQQGEASINLCRLLANASGLPHCFLTTSGAMSNENALKIAFQKNFPAQRVLAFEKCFAGRTLAVSQVTDKAIYREGLPPTITVDYVPFFDPEQPEESTEKALYTIQKYINRYPGQHAIMILELVQGEGGFNTGSKTFFRSIAELLKKNKIAVFADEVQSFGRTPSLFAFQYYGIEEFVDLAAVGKMTQACATLFTDEYAPRAGLLSQTFTASASAIQAGCSVVERLVNGNFYGPNGRIEQIHQRFVNHFEKIAKKHPGKMKGPYGIGAMVAFTPYDGSAKLATELTHRLFEAGLMTFIAGVNPTRVRMLPGALIVTDEEIDEACRIIDLCI